tara:strand:+ start:265 stop:378 length:114 start_codon:yes stop_codon:yes gene_type:complete
MPEIHLQHFFTCLPRVVGGFEFPGIDKIEEKSEKMKI